MNFKLHEKEDHEDKANKTKLNIEKLKDLKRFAPFLLLGSDEVDLDTFIATLTDAASKIMGKHRCIKKHRVTLSLIYVM